jgi:uncharacterized protein (TIGR00288 family)
MSQDRVMLLIDADNVSVDVMEQSVRLLLNQHGGLHVRRAYCTAEGALKHQNAFKRLGIKPMVNLAAGKNSTDIALAVDAIDLVLAERPDVVVIASSDSDFAPLVQRLREKGCVVRGIGQQGKTGDETRDVYDDFTVLEHRKPTGAASPSTSGPAAPDEPPARKSTRARKTTAGSAAAKKAPAKKAAAKSVARPAAKQTAAPAPAEVTAPAPAEAAAPQPEPAQKAARKTARKTTGKTRSPKAASAAAAAVAEVAEQVLETLVAPAPAPATLSSAPSPEPAPHEQARQIMTLLPELGRGETLELRVASQRLREAGLLSKSGTSTKLLGRFPELFELLPPGQPNHLRMRR